MPVGFLGILGILFIALKLCEVITWSWVLVTLPLWVSPALVLAIIAAAIVIGAVVVVIGAIVLLVLAVLGKLR